MQCAACREPTETEPCGACGQSPLLAGRYRLDSLLAEGSFGGLFRATRLADGAAVAIKAIPLRWGDGARSLERIAREARILHELDHPAIPRLQEHFVTGPASSGGGGGGRIAWIVQDFVEGVDLQRDPRRRSVDEVLDILEGLLPTLVYLHSRSPPVIHRDIKPANVILSADQRPILVDFGSVRDALRDEHLGGSTVAGTFGYMAPEQYMGDATPASDLYGLGALAVALLTRKAPHTLSDPHNRIRWHGHAVVPEPIAQFIDRLLEPDPALRPASAAEALQQLRALRSKTSPSPSPVSATTAKPSPMRQEPSLRLAEAERPPMVAWAGDEPEPFEAPTHSRGAGARGASSAGSGRLALVVGTSAGLAILLMTIAGGILLGALMFLGGREEPDFLVPLPVIEAGETDLDLALSLIRANDFDAGREDAFQSNTFRAMRFTAAQMAILVEECDFDDCRRLALLEVFPSVAAGPLTSEEVRTLAETCDFDTCREEVLIHLYPQVSDPERYMRALDVLDYDSSRTRVRRTLNL